MLRVRIGRLVAAAVATAALASALPPGAAADSTDTTIFDPPGISLLRATSLDREQRLDELKELGADAIRITVNWRNFAPDPDSNVVPTFDATNPSQYPSGTWSDLDATIADIQAHGIRVLLSPGGPAPDWATGGGSKGLNRPSSAAFGAFVQALGDRYSGICGCAADGSSPPRVDYWSVWNEPNLFLFLHPQVVHGRVVSGTIYRHLFLAAQAGLDASGHRDDEVLLGETAPSRGTNSSNPLDFLRTVFCLDRRWRPIGHCEPIHASGWAQHPYLPGIAPWQKPFRNYISIGSIDRLTKALRRAYRAGATTSRLPVYVTEFGIESYPEPASRFGVSQQQQAEYLGISEYLLWLNPDVRSYAQFLLTDDPGRRSYLSFQTGLRLADGKPKTSYAAFPMTLVARRLDSRTVRLWGHVRPAGGGNSVQIAYRDPGGGGDALGSVETDSRGYFSTTTFYRPKRRFQASTTLENGRQLQGPFIRAYRFPIP